MNKTLKITVGSFVLSLASVGAAFAHHSFAAEFDGNKPIRIEGTLSKVEWSNPHSYFYVDVKDDKGKVANWGCEGANPGALSRRGFNKGDANLGEHIIVDGYAAKDGSHLLDVRRIYLEGKLVYEGASDDGPGASGPISQVGGPGGR